MERAAPGGLLFLIVFGAAVQADGSPSGVLRRRVAGAARAGAVNPDARFIVTGGVGRHEPAEALVMAELLRTNGVPDNCILVEPESRDTLESAIRCADLVARHWIPGSRVLSCSSPYHNVRCAVLLRALGIPAERAPMPSDRPHVSARKLAYQLLRECAALPWDAALVFGMRLAGRARRHDLH